MLSEALDKTVITDNWQIFLKKLFQRFIHHNEINVSATSCRVKTTSIFKVLQQLLQNLLSLYLTSGDNIS